MAMLIDPKLSIVYSLQPAQFTAVAYKGNFEENIAKIAEMGYDGVELAIRDPDLVEIDRVVTILGHYKLAVPAIGTGQALGEEGLSFTAKDIEVRQRAVKRIKQHISLAQQLNALVILGLIRGLTPPGQTKDQSLLYLKECLVECAGFAEQSGVRLAMEPINRYETDLINTVDQGLDMIKQIGSHSTGLLLDTFHMNIEESDIYQSIRKAGDLVFHFHVADSNRWHPGAGHLDFNGYLGELSSTGYKGWISGEFMPLPDADTAAQQNITTLRHILEN